MWKGFESSCCQHVPVGPDDLPRTVLAPVLVGEVRPVLSEDQLPGQELTEAGPGRQGHEPIDRLLHNQWMERPEGELEPQGWDWREESLEEERVKQKEQCKKCFNANYWTSNVAVLVLWFTVCFAKQVGVSHLRSVAVVFELLHQQWPHVFICFL